MKFSLIIPVKNDNRVFDTIPLLESYMSPFEENYEIIVAGTLSNPDMLPRKIKFIKTSGKKGQNVATGIKYSMGEYVVWIDADCPVSEGDFQQLLCSVKKFDIVLACRDYKNSFDKSRIKIGYRLLRTNIFSSIVNLTFPELKDFDTQAGLKAMKTATVRNMQLEGFSFYGLAFDLELLLRAIARNLKIGKVKVSYVHSEKSVIKTFPATLELFYSLFILKFEHGRYKPRISRLGRFVCRLTKLAADA